MNKSTFVQLHHKNLLVSLTDTITKQSLTKPLLQTLKNVKTTSSAIAHGSRGALCQLKSCQLQQSCMKNHI